MRRRDSRDRVRAQLPPSHYHAGEFGGFGTAILHRGMARRGDILVVVAGALLGSVIPFTLFVILPTNELLLSPTLDKQSVEAGRLLVRWNSLHTVRSVLSGLALLLFLYLAIFKKPL